MRLRKVAALVAASAALAACGSASPDPSSPATSPTTPSPTSPATTLTIGVARDHPGLGVVLGTGPTGFEPALGAEIASRLGLEPVFVPLDLDQRIVALQEGRVDVVLASLVSSAATASQVDLAGPYLVVHQDVMTAAGDPDWQGRTLCAVQGTVGLTRAQYLYAAETLIYPAETYTGCIEMLTNGTVAVVAGDDAILAGFVSRNPGRMSLAGESLAITRYGIGLPPDSPELCEDVSSALAEIIADGTWEDLAASRLGPRYEPDPALNPPEVQACISSR